MVVRQQIQLVEKERGVSNGGPEGGGVRELVINTGRGEQNGNVRFSPSDTAEGQSIMGREALLSSSSQGGSGKRVPGYGEHGGRAGDISLVYSGHPKGGSNSGLSVYQGGVHQFFSALRERCQGEG